MWEPWEREFAPIGTCLMKIHTGVNLLLAVMLVVAHCLLFDHSGIQVTVENTGGQPLRSVVLFVTGNSYNLGGIVPANTAEATVECAGDSHLESEFVGDAGETKRGRCPAQE
jgi:hypothetical protein